MMRYVVAAGALAMMSSLAMAETSTTVVRTSPGYVAPIPHNTTVVRTSRGYAPHKTIVVKKKVNRYGQLVTVKKSRTDGYSGSSVSRTRTMTNPYTGVTRSRTTTVN